MSTTSAKDVAVGRRKIAQRDISRCMDSERTSQYVFFGVLALLFVASTALTTRWCVSLSAMGMPMPGGWTMSMMWMRMTGQSWFSGAAMFLGMWLVMMVAMMLPSLVPTLLKYRRLVHEKGPTHIAALTVLAGAGYFLVWAALGTAAYLVGTIVTSAEMQSSVLPRYAPIATGGAVLLAGLFQFTGWKVRRLARCRDVAACTLQDAPNVRNACRQGIRWGIDCSVCCLGFMVVLLVTGVMNLASMAILAVVIAAERVVRRPQFFTRIAGILIALTGMLLIARTVSVSS